MWEGGGRWVPSAWSLIVWKWILGIFIVCVIGCGVGGYFVSKNEKFKSQFMSFGGGDIATQVRLEPATKGDLVRTVAAPGQIEPRTKVKITAQVSARITALPFKEGEIVKKGDVVVRLDSEDLVAALEAQRAALKADEARLLGTRASFEQARADVARVRDLFEKNVRSKADLEAAEAAFQQAESSLRVGEASIEITRANIRRAERDVQNCVISSPIDGTIIKTYNEVGELVLGTFNNLGQTIMEIADLNVMLMRAEVDESSVAQVAKGQKAKVYVNAYPGKTFTGTVDQVEQQRQLSREQKGYFETEIIIDMQPGESLLAGLTANTDIMVQTQYDVLRVPSQAVLDRRIEELPGESQGKVAADQKNKAFTRVVYKLVDGKAVSVPVVTGTSDLTHTVVLSGLNDGEKVVSGPYKVLAALKDGQALSEMPGAGAHGGAAAGATTSTTPATTTDKAEGASGSSASDAKTSGDSKPSADGGTSTASTDSSKSGTTSTPAPATPN